ncbi:SAG family member [Eimeria brunetti]|uniref:SAG family member n=1 Tax=Eimeria brunetti TaxID=51314 RepID=U6L690_9EIME|nr:SAG family member [Eimeria brunetti]
MAPARLLPFVGATLFVLGNAAQGNGASPGQSATTYSAEFGQDGACLPDVNGLREKVGLTKLVQATEPAKKLPPFEPGENKWDDFCKDVLRGGGKGSKGTVSGSDDGRASAMYAMMVLTSAAVDCTAFVGRVKSAYKGFSGFPPAPGQNTALYENPDVLFFTAALNPSEGANADCRVVTCTETTVTPPSGGQKKERKGYAMLCMTTPNVLSDGSSPPYTKEQWEKIASVLKASAPAVAPSMFFVLLAAIGWALL